MSFKKAWKIFTYLFFLFTILYWGMVIIDDWVFIEEYGTTHWVKYVGIWTAYFLIYSLYFSLIYWSIAAIPIIIYTKIINPKNDT